jgi:hypothetical protein
VTDRNERADTGHLDEYCRAIESHMCRKNDGYLIRIAGPSFELVKGWADQGVPLRIAFAGIDRTFERYYRKGPRRRPVHVGFCDADVLDAFDEWCRAMGVSRESGDHRGPSGASLPAHLDRVVNRLTLLRGDPRNGPDLDAALARASLEIDSYRERARTVRGAAREALVTRLETLDRELVALVRRGLTTEDLARLSEEASATLVPFRDRMPTDAYRAAATDALDRLIREHAGLPQIRYR